MKNIEIIGGNRLFGTLRVQGAKNSVLPILAGTLLNEGKTIINDCPNLSDVHSAFNILRNLGCVVEFRENTAIVDAADVECCSIPDSLMKEMRSSVMFLGAIISRCGEASISPPGGCDIGQRPIDIHIKAFRELGVSIEETAELINCKLDGEILGGKVELKFPSVGATENIMLLAAKSNVVTTIANAAREPEIVDLQNFLNALGANITGAGTSEVTIRGVKSLRNAEYTVIPDRIVASTYLCATAAAGGAIMLTNVVPEHIETVISALRNAGCDVKTSKNTVMLTSERNLKAIAGVETLPYPDFPTDAQALVMATLATSSGTTLFVENLYEDRFKHIPELRKMGAEVVQFKQVAAVSGVASLHGATVAATDLRGGAALVIAALGAQGKTIITNTQHIYRGYENIVRDLAELGAEITHL